MVPPFQLAGSRRFYGPVRPSDCWNLNLGLRSIVSHHSGLLFFTATVIVTTAVRHYTGSATANTIAATNITTSNDAVTANIITTATAPGTAAVCLCLVVLSLLLVLRFNVCTDERYRWQSVRTVCADSRNVPICFAQIGKEVG